MHCKATLLQSQSGKKEASVGARGSQKHSPMQRQSMASSKTASNEKANVRTLACSQDTKNQKQASVAVIKHHTHTGTHRHRHTQTQTQTQTQTHTNTHKHTKTHKHTHNDQLSRSSPSSSSSSPASASSSSSSASPFLSFAIMPLRRAISALSAFLRASLVIVFTRSA